MRKVHLEAPSFPDFRLSADSLTFTNSRRFKFQTCSRLWLPIAVLLLAHLCVAEVHAQGKIVVIEKNLRAVQPPTREVMIIRGADRRAGTVDVIPMNLEIGDVLLGASKEIAVKVICNKSSELVLTGRFIVRFMGAKQGGGCHVLDEPKSESRINVKAGGPTSIQSGASGEIRLGSQRTIYEFSRSDVGQSGQGSFGARVFEGDVNFSSRAGSVTIPPGKKVETEADSPLKIKDLNSNDFDDSAGLFARIDLALSDNVKDLNAEYLKMKRLHREMLMQSGNPAKLMALKKGQQELGLADLVLTLKSGVKGTGNILFVNRCTKPINVRFAIENLPTAHFLTAPERLITPGGEITTSIEFDSSSLEPGRHTGVVTAICVDCAKQRCLMVRQVWTVILNVMSPLPVR